MPQLDDYMKQLSYEMGLDDPLKVEISGNYLLPLDDQTSISIGRSQQGISFTTTVTDLPAFRRGELIHEMMDANLFGQGTINGILALDARGKQIILSRHLDHEVSYGEFNEILEDFVNLVDFWKEESQTKREQY